MKLSIKQSSLSEARKKIDPSLRKIFKYDENFLNGLNKPNKTTFIRFTNEMPGGGLILTPNISQYQSSHTPSAIYGYPLNLVKDELFAQKLDMSHYKYVIVYWVDSDSIVDLSSITKSDLDDLINQIISYGGKEKYLDSLQRWIKRAAAEHRTSDKALATSIFGQDGSVARVTDNQAPSVFWNIVANYGEKSTSKTLLLNKLRLKQKNEEGEIVEKNFSTVLDTNALIDPVPVISGGTGSSIQAFTLSSKYVSGYEIFENPAAVKPLEPGRKKPSSSIVRVQNASIFKNAKEVYLDQRPEIKNLLNQKVKLQQNSNGIVVEFKLPGKTSLIEDFISKNPKINKQNFMNGVTERLVHHLEAINGQRAYGPRISFPDDFYRPGLKTSSSGDTYSITVEYPTIILNVRDVYSFLYFIYLVYMFVNELTGSNPFDSLSDYKSILTNEAKLSK